MKRNQWILPTLALTAAIGIGGIAGQAQPDPNNAPKVVNPANRAARKQRAARPGLADVANMTPEQRVQAAAQRREMQLTRMLKRSGIDDPATADAILAFSKDQEAARQSLRAQAQKVSMALRTQAVPDAQLATLLSDFRAAADKEKDRTAAALKALDAKIDFSHKPRLDALLTMTGLNGDEMSLVGNAMGGRAAAGGRKKRAKAGGANADGANAADGA